MNNMPKVTVITCTYNLIDSAREKVFKQCIESIHNQTYKNIEHIVIDGASNDGTLNLLEEYKNKGYFNYYSEKDDGIYYAMNKGIDKASGKYVVFLNSDDFWHDNRAVEESVRYLEESNADYSYGACFYLDKNDKILGILQPSIECFYVRMPFSHQSMFTKKDCMLKIGKFDTDYKSASDYHFILKLIYSGAKGVEVPLNFVSFRWTGFSISLSSLSDGECIAIHKKMYFEKYNLAFEDGENIYPYFYAPKEFFLKLIHDKDIDEKVREKISARLTQQSFLKGPYVRVNYQGIHRVKILYDLTVFANYLNISAQNTIEFISAFSFLKELNKRKDIDLYFYCDKKTKNKINRFISLYKKELNNLTIYKSDLREIDIFLTSLSDIPQKVVNKNIKPFILGYDITADNDVNVTLSIPDKKYLKNDELSKKLKQDVTQQEKEIYSNLAWESVVNCVINKLYTIDYSRKNLVQIKTIYLFCLIPLIKIKKNYNEVKVYLFNLLIFRIKRKNNTKKYSLFGVIPILQIKN